MALSPVRGGRGRNGLHCCVWHVFKMWFKLLIYVCEVEEGMVEGEGGDDREEGDYGEGVG